MPTFEEQQDAVLDLATEKYGFVPNQIKVLNAHSPAAARTYIHVMNRVDQDCELAQPEKEAVVLAVSRYNDCHYCTRTHAKLGADAGLPKQTIEAIHRGGLPDDPRYRALVRATRLMMDKRGLLNAEDLKSLDQDGISKTDLFEINAIIGAKIFSNYVNHVAQTDVDDLVRQDESIQEMWPVIGKMDWSQKDADA